MSTEAAAEATDAESAEAGASRGNRSVLDLLPWLALALALGPTLVVGYPRGHDWLLELTRVAEFQNALADGQLPPHWAPNLYGGRGAPVFVFYAPLYVAVSSACAVLAGDVVRGSLLALWLFGVAGLVALADLLSGLLRSKGPPPTDAARSAVRVGLVLFLLHPYLITDALLRNASAEFAALCLLPLPLSGVVRLGREPMGGTLRLALGLALVVLAHNLTALVAFGAVLVLGAALHLRSDAAARRRGILAVAAGLALSAWFWWPAFSYRHHVRLGELTTGDLDFRANFGPIFGWGAYHAVGLVPALALALGLAWLAVRLVRREATGDDDDSDRGSAGWIVTAWVAAAGALVSLALQVPASTPLWASLPLLPLFQFPWRFQGPLALTTAVLAAVAWWRFWRQKQGPGPGRARAVAEIALLLAMAWNAHVHLGQVRPLPAERVAQLPTLLTDDGIRTYGLRVTVGDEYLPAEGLEVDDCPFGPDRAPPLRSAGLAVSGLTLLAGAWWLVATRRSTHRTTRPTGP